MLRAKSMKTTFLLAAAFLGSTALAVPVFAQDASAPNFQLTGSGGVLGINIPSYTSGTFGTAGGNMIGGMIGGSITSGKLGDANGWGVVLGLNAFGAFGMGQSASTTQHMAGGTGGPVCGLDCGAGTITLTPGTSAVVQGPGGGTATTAALGGSYDVTAVTPDGTGFELSAVTGPGGGAYGGYGSSSGGEF